MPVTDRLPETRSTYPQVDIRGFFTAVADAIKKQQAEESAPKEEIIKFVEWAPKKRLFKSDEAVRAVTYKVIGAMRANMSTKGVRRDMPREFKRVPHPKLANYQLVYYGFLKEVLVEFEIHATSNAIADEILDWFDSLLLRYTHLYKWFKSRGIDYLAFEKRLEDLIDTETGQELYTRRVQYVVRVPHLDIAEAKSLESLDFNEVSEDGETKRTFATLTSDEPNLR